MICFGFFVYWTVGYNTKMAPKRLYIFIFCPNKPPIIYFKTNFQPYLSGALLITAGVDYFIEEWRLFNYLWYELLNLAPEPMRKPIPCWYSHCILGLWPIFTALGIFTQQVATARKYKRKVERRDLLFSSVF